MSNSQLIIHCGAYKTGSSSLQNHLYSDDKQSCFKYADSGLAKNEPEVGVRHALLIYGDKWKGNCERLVQEVEQSDKPVVVSSEAYSNIDNLEKLDYLVSLCREREIRVSGMLYLRNYFDYVRSYYIIES